MGSCFGLGLDGRAPGVGRLYSLDGARMGHNGAPSPDSAYGGRFCWHASILGGRAQGWMPRVALLIVALAVVALLAGALQPFLRTPLIAPTLWHGEYIVVVALALLTRSLVWRAIALAALTGVAVTNFSYGIALFRLPDFMSHMGH
jgi:hypothetical protein